MRHRIAVLIALWGGQYIQLGLWLHDVADAISPGAGYIPLDEVAHGTG